MPDNKARKRRTRRRVLLAAVLVLLGCYVAGCFGCRGEYCAACGARSVVYVLSAVPSSRSTIQIGRSEIQTPLSRALTPLFPGGVCRHQWVRIDNPRFLADTLRHTWVHERSTSIYDTQLQVAYDRAIASRLGWLGKRDAELARVIAASLLYPHKDSRDSLKASDKFIAAPIPWYLPCPPDRPTAQELERCREFYGLEKVARPSP